MIALFAKVYAALATPSTMATLQDLFELVLPHNERSRRNDPRHFASSNGSTEEESATEGMAFCCMPGEELPNLGVAVRDRTLIDRVKQGLYRGLERTKTPLSTRLPRDTHDWLLQQYPRYYKHEPLEDIEPPCMLLDDLSVPVLRLVVELLCGKPRRIRSKKPRTTLGQRGDRNCIMGSGLQGQGDAEIEPLTTIAVQVFSKEELQSLFDQRCQPADPSGVLDIRLVKGGVGRTMSLGGCAAMAAKMALHVHSAANGRFGLLWAPPLFALTEVVVFEGRTHLMISDLCSMTSVPPSPTAPKVQPFFAILFSIFMSCQPEYRIDDPSDDDLRAWHAAAEGFNSSTPLALLRPMQDLDGAVYPLLHDGEAVISVRHLAGSHIICDAKTNTKSCMVAMGVVLECDNFFGSGLCEAADEAPDVLPWFDMPLADATKLDRLDLLTLLGHGRSATVWKAKWFRRSRPKDEGASSWVAKDDDSVSIVAKVVPAEFATSVAREYFIYTQIVPRLSQAARAYFPKFYGLLRSGWDGGGFVLVMEDGGERITNQELSSSSSSVGREAKAAFELLEKEGLVHWDERAHNVLQRADGRLFIVDWGEARFNPPRPATVKADATFS